MPRFATTGITPRQTAIKCTADCQALLLRWQRKPAARSGLWQSALKFRLLTLAIRSTIILFVAIRDLNTADCHTLQHTFEHGWCEWNPAPAILHQESPCLMCHFFLTPDFSGVKCDIRQIVYNVSFIHKNCIAFYTYFYALTYKV
jgi:hypothetical protein